MKTALQIDNLIVFNVDSVQVDLWLTDDQSAKQLYRLRPAEVEQAHCRDWCAIDPAILRECLTACLLLPATDDKHEQEKALRIDYSLRVEANTLRE